MIDLDPSWSPDRELTDDQHQRIGSAFRTVLSTKDPDVETVEYVDLDDYGELEIQHTEETEVWLNLYTPHGDGPTLVTDEFEDCPHHETGDDLSRLGDLGEAYADLERDLIELAALMCDLPAHPNSMENYVCGPVEFQNLTCYDGALCFTFACFVSYPVVRLYQEGELEIARRLGVPVGPSADEMVGDTDD